MGVIFTLAVATGLMTPADLPRSPHANTQGHIIKAQSDGGSLPGVPGGKAGQSGAAGGAGGAGGGGAPGGAPNGGITEDIIVREFGTNEALIRGRLADLESELTDLRLERAYLRRQLRWATGAGDCDPTVSNPSAGGDGGSLPGAPGGKGGQSGSVLCDDDQSYYSARTKSGAKLAGPDGPSIAGGVGGKGGVAGAGPGGGSGGAGGAGVGGGKGGRGGAGGSSD